MAVRSFVGMPVSLKKTERTLARESSRRLAEYLKTGKPLKVQVIQQDEVGETIAIPTAALQLLEHILTEMAQGNAVTILPMHAEPTTQQAAELMNVSRPYLVRLLEKGTLPFYKVGTHQRLYLKDVLAYKQRVDNARHEVLDELVTQAQELNMGY